MLGAKIAVGYVAVPAMPLTRVLEYSGKSGS
jgi:hypothetical protein